MRVIENCCHFGCMEIIHDTFSDNEYFIILAWAGGSENKVNGIPFSRESETHSMPKKKSINHRGFAIYVSLLWTPK